jgi:hypothetical protein
VITVSSASTVKPTPYPSSMLNANTRNTTCTPTATDRGYSVVDDSRGAVSYAGYAMNHDGTLRAEYQQRSAGLADREDPKQARSDLRGEIQARSSPVGRRLAQHLAASPQRKLRDGAKTKPAFNASAVRTSSAVNALGSALRFAGRGLLAVGIATSAYEIANAMPGERPRVLASEAGSWAGALAGGTAGAEIGGMLGSIIPGPGSVIGAAVGGVAGGVYGSLKGEEIGDVLYDRVTCER